MDSRTRTILRLAAETRWPEQFVVRDSGRGLSDVKKEKVHTKEKSGIKAALFFRTLLVFYR